MHNTQTKTIDRKGGDVIIKKLCILLSLLLLTSCSNETQRLDENHEVPSVRSENYTYEEARQCQEGVGSLDTDNFDFYISANLTFPQLEDSETTSFDLINRQLKTLALDMASTTECDFTKKVDGFRYEENTNIFLVVENEYQVLSIDSNIISIEYSTTISNRYRVNNRKCFATIGVETGLILYTSEMFDIARIKEMIQQGNFDVEEGTYYPGSWVGDEPEVKETFLSAIDSTFSSSEKSPDGFATSATSFSFGITNEDLFLKFDFEDSLNGYVVLKFDINTAMQHE